MRRYPIPSLRRKANGTFFVRFAGRDHSLGSDEAVARARYAQKLAEHAAWRAGREAQSVARSDPGQHLLVDVAQRMLDSYIAEGRPETAKWFAKHLARFLLVHGEARLLDLTVVEPARHIYAPRITPLINAYVADLQSAGVLEPRTLRHDVTAIKRLFNFAADQGLCPAVNWRGLARLRVPRSQPEDIPPRAVAELIDKGAKSDPRLRPWLELNYYAMLRPSETVRLVCAAHADRRAAPVRDPDRPKGRRRRRDARRHRGWFAPLHHRGELLDGRGLFVLPDHKTLDDSGRPRLVLLTPQALSALDRAAPVWSTPSSYSQACRLAGIPGAPHVLRDSAASWLRSLGAPRADVDTLLGHVPRAVSESYTREALGLLYASALRITL